MYLLHTHSDRVYLRCAGKHPGGIKSRQKWKLQNGALRAARRTPKRGRRPARKPKDKK